MTHPKNDDHKSKDKIKEIMHNVTKKFDGSMNSTKGSSDKQGILSTTDHEEAFESRVKQVSKSKE